MDTPLDNPDMEIFTNGISFVWDGKHNAGYAVVNAVQVLKAKSLPPGNQCLVSGACGTDPGSRVKQKQRVNIYTDSKYTYLTLQAHAALWKESLKQPQENLLSISERSRDFNWYIFLKK